MLKARNAVLNMREYHPPLSGRTGLRLDFNENTSGCSPAVLQRLQNVSAEELNRYPERGPVEELVARHVRLRSDELILTNGVDEAIHLVCETYLEPGDEAIIVTPTFGMYELFVQQTGAKVVAVQSDPTEFAFPTERVLKAITANTRLIAFATPNNPTGSVVAAANIRRILEAVPSVAVLVDEAYFEFYGESVLPDISRFENLFVARTFSKAYGLAGLRLGILAASSRNLQAVRKIAVPYNVNSVALACLDAALQDQNFVSQYVFQVVSGRKRLQDELSRRGIQYWDSRANFVLVRIGGRHNEFVIAMRKHGILVRDRNNDPGCSGCVRITLGTLPQTDRLLEAFDQVCTELSIGDPSEKVAGG